MAGRVSEERKQSKAYVGSLAGYALVYPKYSKPYVCMCMRLHTKLSTGKLESWHGDDGWNQPWARRHLQWIPEVATLERLPYVLAAKHSVLRVGSKPAKSIRERLVKRTRERPFLAENLNRTLLSAA